MTATSSTVMTVTGPVPADRLGFTLAHEHLFWDQAHLWSERAMNIDANNVALAPVSFANVGLVRARPYLVRDNLRCDDADLMAKEISLFRDAAGHTVVDVTSIGLGRYPRQLREIARRTGLNVIAGTGYYYPESLSPEDRPQTVDQAAERLLEDLCRGIAGTDICAGIIGEIALDGDRELERLILAAAARAHRQTRAAIGFHSSGDTAYNAACLDFLIDHGVPAAKVAFYHMDRVTTTLEDILVLARRGAFVSFDRFGYGEFLTLNLKTYLPIDGQRIDMVLEVIRQGFIRQTLLSHDLSYKHMLATLGGYGYAHLQRDIVPLLKLHGLDDQQIDVLFVQNPRRLLC